MTSMFVFLHTHDIDVCVLTCISYRYYFIHTHHLDSNKCAHTGCHAWTARPTARPTAHRRAYRLHILAYVLQQQGHAHGMSCLDYSPNGSLIATGGEDGKVKAWNTTSGFCFVTFTEHTAPVKSVLFTPKGNAVVSCSLDGSVRAFDLTRYRNFRTLTTPKPAQFMSLALEASGEIVCAGTQDSFEIFVWSLQTGRLLDVLAGHEGPVSSLQFRCEGVLGVRVCVRASARPCVHVCVQVCAQVRVRVFFVDICLSMLFEVRAYA